jgi:tRNA nucleotidyltransferase (CCA-adding enzyme)
MHDLGKGLTPKEELPQHKGHETAGIPLIREIADRLRVPTEFRDLALLVSRFHTHVHRALELRAGTVLELLESTDAFRRPERFVAFLEACECDARGRAGLEQRDYPQRARLEAMHAAAVSVTLDEAERAQFTGPKYGERLRAKRLAAIAALR